jgi:hypothetical protein
LRLAAAEQPTAPGEDHCDHYNQENYEDGNNAYAAAASTIIVTHF